MSTSTKLACEYDIPESRLRPFAIEGAIPEDQLGRHLLKLMTLHPKLANFRRGGLAQLDAATKNKLLADIYEANGTRPLCQ